jgi:hypothetical protein
VIEAEKAHYSIVWMCRLRGVPRSGFYARRDRVQTETAAAAARRLLAERVRRVSDAGRGAYGCRRVTAQRNRDGPECSVGLVADLMRELGLKAVEPRADKRTTVAGGVPARGSGPDRPGLHRGSAGDPAGRRPHPPADR